MAQIRWYLNNTLLDGWQLVDQTAAAAATMNAGWVVGTGATFSSELQSNTERASTTFVANTVPDGTLDLTLKDAFRSQFAWTGSFAAGNWTFQFAVVSTVQSGAADGAIVFRILKADADGSNATQITTAQVTTTTATNVGATDINITATWAAPAWTITNQYIFVQVAWKRTGAGGMTTTNIRLRTGSSSTVGTTGLTGDFTSSVTTLNIASTVVIVNRGPAVSIEQAVTGTTIGVGSSVNLPSVAYAVSGQTIISTARVFYTETLLFEHSSTASSSTASAVGRNNSQTVSGHAGVLTSVSLLLTRGGSPSAPTDAMYLVIRDSTFNGTVLDSSVPVDAVVLTTGNTWVNFRFWGGAILSAGTTYWIQCYLTRLVAQPNHRWGFNKSATDTYVGGGEYNPSGVATGGDWAFRLYTGTSHTVIDTTQFVSGQTIYSTALIFYTETLLFEQASTNAQFAPGAIGRQGAQTISGHSGVLTSISLRAEKTTVSPSGSIYLELRDSSFNGPLLATSSVILEKDLPTSPAGGAWTKFVFSVGIDLVAGTTYWIEVYWTSPADLFLRSSTLNPYAGGSRTSSGGTLVPAEDWCFRLYTGTSHTVVAEAPAMNIRTLMLAHRMRRTTS